MASSQSGRDIRPLTTCKTYSHHKISAFMQKIHNSSALAMEPRLFCFKLSKWWNETLNQNDQVWLTDWQLHERFCVSPVFPAQNQTIRQQAITWVNVDRSSFMSSYGITRPQWVKINQLRTINFLPDQSQMLQCPLTFKPIKCKCRLFTYDRVSSQYSHKNQLYSNPKTMTISKIEDHVYETWKVKSTTWRNTQYQKH